MTRKRRANELAAGRLSKPDVAEELCDRVLVFARGRFRTEVGRGSLSKAELLRQCYAAVAA